jgi:predicted RNA binding protein YcfA (HicA-like mRNA interferase family)
MTRGKTRSPVVGSRSVFDTCGNVAPPFGPLPAGAALARYRIRYHTPGVSRKQKLLARVRGNPHGVSFDELVRLAEAVGFVLARTQGSHHIFSHPRRGIPLVNLQRSNDGKAKPYQVAQVLDLIDTHHLEIAP